MEKLLLTTKEAAEVLGIGRSTVYELMYAGHLESVRIGAARRIPTVALEEFVRRLREQEGSAA